MKLIIDANITFSAILNTNSRIAELIINKHFEFIAPTFLRDEIKNHYSKIMKITGMSLDEIHEIEFLLYKHINFINEEQISPEFWIKAYHLVSDIDEKDTSYIAYSQAFNCKIWSGDKKLISGLKLKKYNQFYTTTDLLLLIENK